MSARIPTRNQEKDVFRPETSMHVLGPLAYMFPLDILPHPLHDPNGPIRLGE